MVAGTSMGAFIGALRAESVESEEIKIRTSDWFGVNFFPYFLSM